MRRSTERTARTLTSFPSMPIRRVAVVVLCWNGVQDTLPCLRSLLRSDWPSLDVIVVDNGSTDGTLGAVRAEQNVIVIENGRNLGFAEGNNVGIARAMELGADAVFVLNNDTLVDSRAVRRLVEALDSDASAAACSPALRFTWAPSKLWFAGAPYDPNRIRSGRASVYERGAPLPDRAFQIDRVAGAAMLVRREVIEQVGTLADELFFLHEDVDWSLRMRQAGWHLLLVPQADVKHSVAASQGGEPVTPVTAYYGTRNDLELGRRHGRRRGVRAITRQVGCLVVHVAQVRRAAPGTRIASLRATGAGAIDFRLRKLGERRS